MRLAYLTDVTNFVAVLTARHDKNGAPTSELGEPYDQVGKPLRKLR
jgi:hypothetical protein